MGDDDLEIKEVEDYYGSKSGETFSHSQLVMISMKRCIEAGSKEMREGYVNEKADKYGNMIRTNVPDTRKEFIESVETLMMVMADDIDQEAKNRIGTIKNRLNRSYNKFCKYEKEEWKNAHINIKEIWQKQGISQRDGMLHRGFPYYVEYIMEKVKAYRRLFAQLKKLTQRKDYYREEEFHA
jgi:hypothetical protein